MNITLSQIGQCQWQIRSQGQKSGLKCQIFMGKDQFKPDGPILDIKRTCVLSHNKYILMDQLLVMACQYNWFQILYHYDQ